MYGLEMFGGRVSGMLKKDFWAILNVLTEYIANSQDAKLPKI